jgi:hypothetical protein
MKQLQLFDDKEYYEEIIDLKSKILQIIEKYEDKNSWLYQDTEALIDFIKFMII